MTQEKTEKPSRKKLKRAREQGQVVYSAELTAAILVLGALFVIWFSSSLLEGKFLLLFETTFGKMKTCDPVERLASALKIFLYPVILLMGVLFFMNLLSHIIQKGWIWKQKQGKSASFILSAPIKVFLIGIIGYFTIKPPSSQGLFLSLFFLLLKVSIALVIFGLGDLIYQKWRFYQKMQMTKHELKEEQREERNPEVKKWNGYRQK